MVAPRMPLASASVSFSRDPYTADQLETIVQTLRPWYPDTHLPPASVDTLQDHAKTYCMDENMRQNTPRAAQQKRLYETWQKHLRGAVDLCEGFSLAHLELLVEQCGSLNLDGTGLMGHMQAFEQNARTLLVIFAVVARHLPPDQGGRSPAWPLHAFIRRLASFYTAHTKRPPGRGYNNYTRRQSGPFVRFVTACLAPLVCPLDMTGRDDFPYPLQATTYTPDGIYKHIRAVPSRMCYSSSQGAFHLLTSAALA